MIQGIAIFGLNGGDMFEQQMEFRKVVGNRDSKAVEESAIRLACPVIVIDGTLSVSQNLEKIIWTINHSARDCKG